jgi:murein DD-endopeptidase MepM/ murein hydrolase activator NlpD
MMFRNSHSWKPLVYLIMLLTGTLLSGGAASVAPGDFGGEYVESEDPEAQYQHDDVSLEMDLLPPTPGSTRVNVPKQAYRGEAVSVTVQAPRDVRVTLTATPPERRSVDILLVDTGIRDDEQHWYGLIGLDHTLPAGELLIAVVFSHESQQWVQEERVEIGYRQFVEEEIQLTAALTGLRQRADPERQRQSQELWDLLHVVDKTHQHHTGTFMVPIRDPYRETSSFGHRRTFVYSSGSTARSVHNGVDFASPIGTAVYAPGGGRVVMSQDRIITGETIILAHHPGMYSLYYHLSRRDVAVGDIVAFGQKIGELGSTGLSTGPHLHWEVRIHGAAVDPFWFVRHPVVDRSVQLPALLPVP